MAERQSETGIAKCNQLTPLPFKGLSGGSSPQAVTSVFRSARVWCLCVRQIKVSPTGFGTHYSIVGLPTVPYFPGRPVSWPRCSASRPRFSRDAKFPVFRPWTNDIEIVQQMYAGS